MTLYDLATTLRRRWLIVLGLPLVVALISLAFGLTRPPQYESSGRVIATRGVADPNSTAGMTWAREDTVAQDLPTIISSAVFAQDVATELERRGLTVDAAQVAGALRGTNEGKIVTIIATSADPEQSRLLAEAAIAMLGQNGLRYWGDQTWSPDEPGVNIGPLDLPSAAVAVPSRREIAIDAGLRAAVGLILAVALALGFDALGRRTTNDERRTTNEKHSVIS